MFWPCLELPGESLLSLWSAGEKVKGEREKAGSEQSSPQISDDLLRRLEAPRGRMLCI